MLPLPSASRSRSAANAVSSARSCSRFAFGAADVVSESGVDVGLVAAPVALVGLEPGDDIRVQAQGDLLLHRPVEHTSFGVRPVEDFGDIVSVDFVLGLVGQRLNLGLYVWGQFQKYPSS